MKRTLKLISPLLIIAIAISFCVCIIPLSAEEYNCAEHPEYHYCSQCYDNELHEVWCSNHEKPYLWDIAPHTYEMTADSTGHWEECLDCGYIWKFEDHAINDLGVCTVCSFDTTAIPDTADSTPIYFILATVPLTVGVAMMIKKKTLVK